jgi:hypothetical protein
MENEYRLTGLFGVPVLPQKLVIQQLQGFLCMGAKMPHLRSHITKKLKGRTIFQRVEKAFNR